MVGKAIGDVDVRGADVSLIIVADVKREESGKIDGAAGGAKHVGLIIGSIELQYVEVSTRDSLPYTVDLS